MQVRFSAPGWGFAAAWIVVCGLVLPTAAQPRGKADKNDKTAKADKTEKADKSDKGEPAVPKAGGKKSDSPKTYDFNALDLNGRMRTPQLLYFLERANEELERATLEKRSFIPHMVRSIDEEAL
jgi:hypothetical protein